MARAQIFIFDVMIAATAFFLLALVFAGLSRPEPPQARQAVYAACLSSLEALMGNGTIPLVANGTEPESLLNTSVSQLPSRFGYQLNVTTYGLSGSEAASYIGISGNLTEAELYKDIIASESNFATDNATPLLGVARMRCWVQ